MKGRPEVVQARVVKQGSSCLRPSESWSAYAAMGYNSEPRAEMEKLRTPSVIKPLPKFAKGLLLLGGLLFDRRLVTKLFAVHFCYACGPANVLDPALVLKPTPLEPSKKTVN